MAAFADVQGYYQPVADLHGELGTEVLDFGWAGVRLYRGLLENA